MNQRPWPLALLAAAPLCVALSGTTGERRDDAALRQAGKAFLGALSAEHRTQAQMAFDDPARLDWHFIPRERKGLPLGAMTDGERQAAHALLRTGLSSRGYLQALGVLDLEGVLREQELAAGRDGSFRDPGRYFFSLFGDPAGDAPFQVRIEGHHLALNFASVPEDGTAVTPTFFGANPAEVQAGPRAGTRVLAAEEDLARALVRSLDEAQRKRAIIADAAPAEVLFGPGKPADPGRFEGLAASALRAEQRSLLRQLVAEYVEDLRPELAAHEFARIDAAGFDGVHFAWAGGLEPREGHYYRVHGPTFILEYDNTQNDANHVHALWRDPKNDLAADWLARHHANEANPRAR